MVPSNLRLWLRLSSNNDAVLSRVDSTFLAALSLVFLDEVGLICRDLRGAALTLREACSLVAAAQEASLSRKRLPLV